MKKILLTLIMILLCCFVGACTKEEPNETNNDKIENVISLINKLPEEITYTTDVENKLIEIENLYNELTKEEQKKVTNYDTFIEKLNLFNKLKEAKEAETIYLPVYNLIEALPSLEEFTLDHVAQIENAKKAYDELDKKYISYITNIDKLNNLLNKVEEYKQVIEINNQIASLPEVANIIIDDQEKVTAVRGLYDALSEDLKALIENYSKLENLEKALDKQLKDVKKVVDLIDNLPSIEDLTYENKKQVETTRGYYTILAAKLKPYVTNLNKLEEIEEKMDELILIERYKEKAKVVIDLINALPEPLTIADRNTVDEVVKAYDDLLEEEKPYVTNYQELISKVEEMEEIIANTSYEVVVVLNGGYLENMTEDTELKEEFSFNVNYYSTGIWSYYTTNSFIYKTSLMNAADQFTSFLKIGFSIDSKTNKYLVKQIVNSGTALTTDLRTCDYYLLVHSDYAEGYANIAKIELNQYLSFNVELPSSATTTLSATVSVLTYQETGNFILTFKGYNSLPAPQRAGYIFLGWYLDASFTSEAITEVSKGVTIYAKWTADKGEITTDTILNCVSDLASSTTEDILLLENDEAKFTWTSSNNNLYQIKGDKGIVSRIHQTHKKQQVTITVKIDYKAGGSKTVSKEITVDPILFATMSPNPIATYFYTGAISAYKKYNDRYVSEKTLFSETTKETLDIVYYAFIVPTSTGGVSFQDTTYLEEVKRLREHNVRILGCVNGVGSSTSQAFKTITASPTLRATFINNLMNLVEQYNLDGLDLDWEAVSESLKPVASQYNLLCQELRAEMDKRQDAGGSPYLLTMAVPASSYGTESDRFDFKTLNKYLDYINIMSYDLNNSSKTTHLSPLYTSRYDNGYGFGAVYGVNRISSLGFDKNKLIVGCAGYGKAYIANGTGNPYPGLGVSGTLTKISGYDGSFASGTVYGSVINQLIKSGEYTQYTEKDNFGNVVGSYLYNSSKKIFITYDSKEAVMAKYEYAKANGLGMMCWAYTEDTSDTVINAIYEAKNK